MSLVNPVFLFLFFLQFFFTGLNAQTIPGDIEEQFQKYGETWLKVHFTNDRDLTKLSSFTSVAGITGDTALVNVSVSEFLMLVREGFRFIHVPLVRPPDEDLMRPEKESSGNWDYYPTWEEYDSIMYAFGQNNPSLCNTFNFLTLPSGRKLLIVKLTSQVSTPAGKPLFLYTSTIHGNETAGYILMLRLIDHLLTGYGNDPEATWLLDNLEIWICPLANPDGTYYGGNHTVSGSIRRNGSLVDLNRNYPDPRVGPNPDGNPYQIETVAFMGLADTINFVMGANLHSGAEVANYPWDTWYKLHPDDQWWIDISRRYADTTQAASPFGFFTDLNNGITNGAAWYVITGGRQDYMNYFHHCRELTLEVSQTFIQPANELQLMWNYHHRSLINFLKDACYGLRGTVTDSVTGLPLKARVWIDQHDADSSHVWSEPQNGNYFRPVYPGSYSVTWSSPGYKSKTQTVNVPQADTAVADVALVPVGTGIAGNDPGKEITVWYDNAGSSLHFSRVPPTGTMVTVYSSDGRKVEKYNDPDINIQLKPLRGVFFVIVESPGYNRRILKIAGL